MNFDLQKQCPHCHNFEDKSTDYDSFLLYPAFALFKEDWIREMESGLLKIKTHPTLISMLLATSSVADDSVEPNRTNNE